MNDLPLNDWNVLNRTLEPLKPHFDEFFFKKICMYNQIAKSGTVHVAYSSFAQHWLSNGSPIDFPEGSAALQPNQLDSSSNKRKIWVKAAADD